MVLETADTNLSVPDDLQGVEAGLVPPLPAHQSHHRTASLSLYQQSTLESSDRCARYVLPE